MNFKSKSILTLCLIGAFTFSVSASAQSVDKKRDLAAKLAALQQGPESESIVQQLTASVVQPRINALGPKFESQVPKDRQPAVREKLGAELNKFGKDVHDTIAVEIKKAATEVLVPAYSERFSEDELRQLVTFFNSPVIKKYQAAAPELGNMVVHKTVEDTTAVIQQKSKDFDTSADKILDAELTKK